MALKHAVVLGDPEFFRIKGGRNPYTRTRWGLKKIVNRKKAREQWARYRKLLDDLGAVVYVIQPEENHPGSVFPANAGFLYPKHDLIPWPEKIFYLSRMSPHREGEAAIYRRFFQLLGLSVETIEYPLEGEADFFPAGDFYIFAHGALVKTGFRPAASWPPYEYVFSHRSDERNRDFLRRLVHPHEVLEVRLTNTRYYHGDTALFAFGPKREYLLAYLDAMDPPSRERLRRHFGDRLIPLVKDEAESFAANSFQLDTPRGPHLIFPKGVPSGVLKKVSRLGFPVSEVDVSEFFQKGGGAVKCLLCDLGPRHVD